MPNKHEDLLIFYMLLLAASFCWPCNTPKTDRTVYIIVHGTWACGTAWANVGGDFFNTLERSVSAESCILPYTWNGKLDHESRLQAATGLAQLIQSYPEDTDIQLIAHSHGANVALVATQLLAQNNKPTHAARITNFFALGAPVNTLFYKPAMNMIGQLFNLFSFEDLVQPVFGFFERVYPAQKKVFNIRVLIDGKEPGHSELHAPIVGSALSHLPALIQENKKINQENALKLALHSKEPACITIDHEREKLLERDQRLIQLFWQSASRSVFFKNPSNTPLTKR